MRGYKYRYYRQSYRKTSEKEIVDLLIAYTAVTFAFTSLYVIWGTRSFDFFIFILPITALATFTGFVVHELSHKFVAIKYGYWAEFRLWKFGLLITIISPLLGFIFAAPGAVVVMGLYTDPRKYGRIALAGPLSNIVMSVLFIVLTTLTGVRVLYYIAVLNMWLALFNLVPFPPLDGYKVFVWDKRVWAIFFAMAAGLYVYFHFLI